MKRKLSPQGGETMHWSYDIWTHEYLDILLREGRLAIAAERVERFAETAKREAIRV